MFISKYYRALLRLPLNLVNRMRLKNKNFSILCNNCVGGVISHELGQRFNSPTVNLFMSSEDYIKFLTRLPYYITVPLKEIQSDKEYPVGVLNDIILYFMHYSSFEEASEKWHMRVKRLNMDNLYVILVEQQGCTENIVKSFCNLPYKHKAVLSTKMFSNCDCVYLMPNCEEEGGGLIDICRYKSKFTGKRWLDEFDYVNFLNQ